MHGGGDVQTYNVDLVNQSVANKTKVVEISPGLKNRSLFADIFSFLHSNLRGPGFWKLNTCILSKTDNVKQIKKTTKGTLGTDH